MLWTYIDPLKMLFVKNLTADNITHKIALARVLLLR